MIPIWVWKTIGLRKLEPGQPLTQPISDLTAIASYQEDLDIYQNRQSNQPKHTPSTSQSYIPTTVSPPLWRI